MAYTGLRSTIKLLPNEEYILGSRITSEGLYWSGYGFVYYSDELYLSGDAVLVYHPRFYDNDLIFYFKKGLQTGDLKIKFPKLPSRITLKYGSTIEVIDPNVAGDFIHVTLKDTDLIQKLTLENIMVRDILLQNKCSNVYADADDDGYISIVELMNYISDWKAGSVDMMDLMTVIGGWKNGC